jgi:hypothetical protein
MTAAIKAFGVFNDIDVHSAVTSNEFYLGAISSE